MCAHALTDTLRKTPCPDLLHMAALGMGMGTRIGRQEFPALDHSTNSISGVSKLRSCSLSDTALLLPSLQNRGRGEENPTPALCSLSPALHLQGYCHKQA